jgi:hypothetical protein
MAQVFGLRANPVGRLGLIVQFVILPPWKVGVRVVICVSLMNVKDDPEYTKLEGGTIVTPMVRVAVAFPPKLEAVIAYCEGAVLTVGAPLMAQLLELNTNPVGRSGLIVQFAIGPPPLLTVRAVICVSLIKENEVPV